MNKLETKVFHTIGFLLVKIFPREPTVSVKCVTEDTGIQAKDMVNYFKTNPGIRLGLDGTNWDWSNDILYTKPNSFRYLKYRP